jgi:hypothetical protein
MFCYGINCVLNKILPFFRFQSRNLVSWFGNNHQEMRPILKCWLLSLIDCLVSFLLKYCVLELKRLSWSCNIADTVCSCPQFMDDSHIGVWTERMNTTDVITCKCHTEMMKERKKNKWKNRKRRSSVKTQHNKNCKVISL